MTKNLDQIILRYSAVISAGGPLSLLTMMAMVDQLILRYLAVISADGPLPLLTMMAMVVSRLRLWRNLL
jgi:hypothetical protein